MDTYHRSAGQEKVIDWQSAESRVLINSHWPAMDVEALIYLSDRFAQESHLWIPSSGSSAKDLRSVKLIALSKQAFLVAARAANEHLDSNAQDVWINPLPSFHVGGLSIYARAHLSGASVVPYLQPWNAMSFFHSLQQSKATLTSLVPTQVFDLVEQKIKSPSHLRAIVVGGGALALDLYEKALELGWPVLPSFGMTEACSQIATAPLESLKTKNPSLKVLSHLKVQTTEEGKLKLQGDSLLTGYAQWKEDEAQWIDPKESGWLITEDKVSLEKNYLKPLGREQQYIKILGEGVSLFRLQEIFEQVVRSEDPECWSAYALLAVPHQRKENELVVAHAASNPGKMSEIIKKYNSLVLSIEKVERIFSVKQIPRSDLGKIKYEQLAQDLKKLF